MRLRMPRLSPAQRAALAAAGGVVGRGIVRGGRAVGRGIVSGGRALGPPLGKGAKALWKEAKEAPTWVKAGALGTIAVASGAASGVAGVGKTVIKDTLIDGAGTLIEKTSTGAGSILTGGGNLAKGTLEGTGSALKGTGEGLGATFKGMGEGAGALRKANAEAAAERRRQKFAQPPRRLIKLRDRYDSIGENIGRAQGKRDSWSAKASQWHESARTTRSGILHPVGTIRRIGYRVAGDVADDRARIAINREGKAYSQSSETLRRIRGIVKKQANRL